MSKYYELINRKNDFLNEIINKYCDNPKEGKRIFILSYLKTCSVFMDSRYSITTETNSGHYFNVFTYLDKEDYDSAFFEEINIDKLIEFVEQANKSGEYDYDYIRINTPNKKTFSFTIKEYLSFDNYDISGGWIKTETWTNDKEGDYYSSSYFLYDLINNSKKYDKRIISKYPDEKCNNINLNMKPKELIVYGGRPAMGKTVLSINSALKEVDKGGEVLFITLNDTVKNIGRKMAGIRAEISIRHAVANKYTDIEYERMEKAFDKMHNIHVAECNHYNIGEIIKVITLFSFKPSLIIIDDFQSIHYKDAYPKTSQEIEYISKQLKNLANKINATIVVTSQISRSVEMRKNKRPKLKDINGGSKLGEIADRVYMIYRENYYLDIDDENREIPIETMEVIDVKEKQTILCNFDRSTGTINETNATV